MVLLCYIFSHTFSARACAHDSARFHHQHRGDIPKRILLRFRPAGIFLGPAFDAVRLALAAVKHGPLAAYTFEKDELVVVAEEAPAATEAEADVFELVAAA